jgi:hypothetical protein
MPRRKPIVHRVKHKNLPKGVRHLKGVVGCQIGEHIYLDKDKSSDSDLHHEIYHYKKNHPSKPRTPRKLVRGELEASIYASEKSGRHPNMKKELRGITNELGDVYQLPVGKALRVVSSEVRKKDIPKTWKRDFNTIASQAYKGRKLPKDVRVKEL